MGIWNRIRVHRHDVVPISGGVRNSLTLKYNLAGITTNTLTLNWKIFNTIANTLQLIYSIPIVFVSNTLDIVYDSRQALFLKKNVGTFTATTSVDIGDMVA